ncbi:hypothetical protein GCM10009754_84570 [Amycolatopsis minnesotensis]|uniref:Uncharacterized protein n=1 Tax=Amycolatopsis minnesotensis TaxID=337894 RepID=A0ABP5E8A5_9PSEU
MSATAAVTGAVSAAAMLTVTAAANDMIFLFTKVVFPICKEKRQSVHNGFAGPRASGGGPRPGWLNGIGDGPG